MYPTTTELKLTETFRDVEISNDDLDNIVDRVREYYSCHGQRHRTRNGLRWEDLQQPRLHISAMSHVVLTICWDQDALTVSLTRLVPLRMWVLVAVLGWISSLIVAGICAFLGMDLFLLGQGVGYCTIGCVLAFWAIRSWYLSRENRWLFFVFTQITGMLREYRSYAACGE